MRIGQAYQQKTEKIFVYEEKKFGRIDSWLTFLTTIKPNLKVSLCLQLGHEQFRKCKFKII